MPDYSQGGIIGGPSITVTAHGRCPLDGYQLIEIEDIDITINGKRVHLGGGWDHVVPISHFAEGQRTIAEAHAFEVSAAAEQIANAKDE